MLKVIDAHLSRIETVNPKLNAVVHVDAEAARKRAREADAALAKDEFWGPLHGVPMTIKDSLDTAGVPSTWGTFGRAGFVPEQDATVVARLKAAGAILLGKTNTPELTLSFETNNPVYGRTYNPYDLARSPGGSSGGAAATVAAAGSPFDIGSDTGGSIRLPAHYCGIAGLKPTSGRVPRTGHAIPPGGLVDSFTQLGPLTRTVADLALIWPLIAGSDGRDPGMVPVSIPNHETVDISQLRAAYFEGIEAWPVSAETSRALTDTVGALRSTGMKLEERTPPSMEHVFELHEGLVLADGGAWIKMLLESTGTSWDQSTLGWAERAPALDPAELVRLIDRWDRFRSSMLEFMDSYDLIVSPVAPSPALLPDEMEANFPSFYYTMAHNLTGWPAIVVPVAQSDGGLPIGAQIASRPWREDVALAVGEYLETALGGWRPPNL